LHINEKLNTTNPNYLKERHVNDLVQLEKYRLLVESIQDYAIFLMDENGYIQTWNKGAEKNKGYKAEDIIGKHFSIFYQEQDKAENKPERELRIAKKYGRVEDEDWRVRKDGTKFWANVVITALYDNDNKLVGFAKVTRDLSERREHEEELRIANIKLKHQQRELQQLNTYKDEFISLASHQLRTPATIIKQLLGMLLEGFDDEELSPRHHKFIQKVYENNERQILLVNNLLKVAQVDAGKITIKKLPVEINEFIHEAIEDQKNTFEKRGQKIILRSSPQTLKACIDVEYFRMALENLLDNASKYTPTGGEVIVSVTKENKDSFFNISIKDNGVGIEKKDINKLFGKFSRIPNDLSVEVGGSGLGLYWVEKIIHLHGGTITVKSKINQGSTFSINMPMR
jgi:PAS domain S-box-containing protein